MRKKKEINIRVGKNIQTVREGARYTQEELSEILDITPNHLSAIERGASGATLEMIEKLHHLFGTSADFLLFNGDMENNFATELAAQINCIKPAYRPQIRKILLALLKVLIMQERENET